MLRLTSFLALVVLGVGVEQVQGAWMVTQLATTGSNPQVSGSNVVWQAGNSDIQTEIFLYDGTDITQLTDNNYYDRDPQVSGSNVVWLGWDGNDVEIFLYDGTDVTQLTDNSYNDDTPQVSGSNVVWQGGGAGNDAEIFLYDGSTTRQLTNNSYNDQDPHVSGSNVVWEGIKEDIGVVSLPLRRQHHKAAYQQL